MRFTATFALIGLLAMAGAVSAADPAVADVAAPSDNPVVMADAPSGAADTMSIVDMNPSEDLTEFVDTPMDASAAEEPAMADSPAEQPEQPQDMEDDQDNVMFMDEADADAEDNDSHADLMRRNFQQTKEKNGMGQKTWIGRSSQVKQSRPDYDGSHGRQYAPKYRRDFQQTKTKSSFIDTPIVFDFKGQKTWIERPSQVKQARPDYGHGHGRQYAPKYRRDFQQTKTKSSFVDTPIVFDFKSQKTWIERPSQVKQTRPDHDRGHGRQYAPKYRRDFQQTKTKSSFVDTPIVFDFKSQKTWIERPSQVKQTRPDHDRGHGRQYAPKYRRDFQQTKTKSSFIDTPIVFDFKGQKTWIERHNAPAPARDYDHGHGHGHSRQYAPKYRRDFQQTKTKSTFIDTPIVFDFKGQKTWIERPSQVKAAPAPRYRKPFSKSYATKYRRDFQQTKTKSSFIDTPIVFDFKGQKTWIERHNAPAPVTRERYGKSYNKY
ncbi:hypothetical protein BJ085DRAFT_27699 [Dimargaris cristalligena]|uniref:Btz domain-containing protein n=1 Tax=Dimargaris cristalligena TaxID=215637 RepID=A0A4P9ZRW6_9FUNG|nr:hypothetical protein BJ085DRAFT_27699 [Dimargaris cristalligena]|eukprot:RKP35928.1 hypothetical protein BJ085DRAFT_27699 [Dimargaris cristalligena]